MHAARLGPQERPVAVRLWLADLEPRPAHRRSEPLEGARLSSRAVSVVARESRHAGTAGPRARARPRRLVHRHRVPARGRRLDAASRSAVAPRNGDGLVPAGVAAVRARRRPARRRAGVRDAPRRAELYRQAARRSRQDRVRLRERPLRHHARLRQPHRPCAARKRHARPRARSAARALPRGRPRTRGGPASRTGLRERIGGNAARRRPDRLDAAMRHAAGGADRFSRPQPQRHHARNLQSRHADTGNAAAHPAARLFCPKTLFRA